MTQKFSPWQLPDPDTAHLVVGRNNWSDDALLAQIEARQGQTLRIDCQEMWSAAMATGCDPFDAEDPELLQAFAADHDALQFLIGQEQQWPLFFVVGFSDAAAQRRKDLAPFEAKS